MRNTTPLLILHGAIGAADQFDEIRNLFAADADVRVVEFPGHGKTGTSETNFSIEGFSAFLLGWMADQKIETADIFGYSMGGYVALHLALHHPEKVGKIMTLATKFAWDEETSSKEVKMLDPEKIAEKIPAFAQSLEKRHTAIGWKNVLNQTAEMMLALGKNPVLTSEDFPKISNKVRLSVGDRDKMVSLEETINVYSQLPSAELSVMPSTPHPIEQVNKKWLVDEINEFFSAGEK